MFFDLRYVISSLLLACYWIPSGSLQAQPIVPVGSEMQVNVFTPGGQLDPRLAVTGDGFVVVWRSNDGDSSGIAARSLDSTGSPVGDEFLVNQQTSGRQEEPAITTAGDGFAIVWADDYPAPDDATSGIRLRLFDGANQPVTGEIVVNSASSGEQYLPVIATRPEGGFVVVWAGDASLDSDIQGRVVDASGTPLATDFQVNNYTTGNQTSPFLAPDGEEMIVVWYNETGMPPGSDTDAGSIQTRRLDSLGQPVGEDFQVNTFTTYYQYAPSVLADGIDGFVVGWSSYTRNVGASEYDAVLRRFNSDGSPVGPDFVISQGDEVNYWPIMAADGVGGFVVVWEDDRSAGDQILARRLDASGAFVGEPIALTTTPTRRSEAFVASRSAGDFVAVWDAGLSTGSDTDDRSIQVRRFAFDTDEDGAGDPVDTCTDTDGDGFGNPGFPVNVCPEDNCPGDPNPNQTDIDDDGIGGVCDLCLGDNKTGDSDGDGVCGNLDICLGDDSSGDQDGDDICADRDCNDMDAGNACAIFADGFETGDTSIWG